MKKKQIEKPSKAVSDGKRSRRTTRKTRGQDLPEVAREEIVAREHLVGKEPVAAKTSGSEGPGLVPEYQTVARRAFEIWQESGCPDGQDVEHWLQAESELRRS